MANRPGYEQGPSNGNRPTALEIERERLRQEREAAGNARNNAASSQQQNATAPGQQSNSSILPTLKKHLDPRPKNGAPFMMDIGPKNLIGASLLGGYMGLGAFVAYKAFKSNMRGIPKLLATAAGVGLVWFGGQDMYLNNSETVAQKTFAYGAIGFGRETVVRAAKDTEYSRGGSYNLFDLTWNSFWARWDELKYNSVKLLADAGDSKAKPIDEAKQTFNKVTSKPDDILGTVKDKFTGLFNWSSDTKPVLTGAEKDFNTTSEEHKTLGSRAALICSPINIGMPGREEAIKSGAMAVHFKAIDKMMSDGLKNKESALYKAVFNAPDQNLIILQPPFDAETKELVVETVPAKFPKRLACPPDVEVQVQDEIRTYGYIPRKYDVKTITAYKGVDLPPPLVPPAKYRP